MEHYPTTVTFTVKELLARLDAKIDGIVDMLERKAEKAEVELLSQRVSILERDSAEVLAIGKYKRWLVGLSATVAGVVIALLALVLHVS